MTQFLSVPFPQLLKESYSTRRIWACTQALVTGSSDHYLHTIFTLIKTITKFSNVIGCHQWLVGTNRTVDKESYSTRRIWACTQALVTGSSDHYLHTIFTLIKTITKFSNVIGCHQWLVGTNRTVDTSSLCKWTVSDVVAHFAELIVFLMKTYNWCLFSLSNFVIVLTNWKQEFKSSNYLWSYS